MQLNQQYFQCYHAMRTATSNLMIGLGNGKCISVMQLPNGHYLITNNLKYMLSYKMSSDSELYNMPSKHIILPSMPYMFYRNALTSNKDLSLTVTIGNDAEFAITHTLVPVSSALIRQIKKEFIDRHFVDTHKNDTDNGYLYKLEISDQLIDRITYDAGKVAFTFHDVVGDIINSYKAGYCYYNKEIEANIIYTNSITCLLSAVERATAYINKHITNKILADKKVVADKAMWELSRAIGDSSVEEIQQLVETIKKYKKS